MLRVLFLALFLPGPCLAGAWPREAGATYLSYTLTLEDPRDSGRAVGHGALFLEYGLTERLTLGIDAGTDDFGKTRLVAFAVLPLSPASGATKVSAEIGLGQVDGRAVVRPGLSVGRGFALFGRQGWISLDSTVALQIDAGKSTIETDLTFGIGVAARSRFILQLQQGGPFDDSDYLRLVPSMVFERGPGRHLEIGVTAGLKSAADAGLKVAVWREF